MRRGIHTIIALAALLAAACGAPMQEPAKPEPAKPAATDAATSATTALKPGASPAATPEGSGSLVMDGGKAPAAETDDAPTSPTAPMRVKLSWHVSTEKENAKGFIVSRGVRPLWDDLKPVNDGDPLLTVGHANTEQHNYYYYDLDVQQGQKWYYGISVLGDDGGTTHSYVFSSPALPKRMTSDEAALIKKRGRQFHD